MKKLGLLLTLLAFMATSANAGYWRSTPNIYGGYDMKYYKDASDFYNLVTSDHEIPNIYFYGFC